jgi:hypothetical protein
MGEEMRILSLCPCGTSRVILHAAKSYDMGPSRFTSHPTGRCAADFITLKKIHRLDLVRTRNLWVQWKARGDCDDVVLSCDAM